MMIDTSHLESTLQHRLKLIAKFDAIDAKCRYECWRYFLVVPKIVLRIICQSVPCAIRICIGQLINGGIALVGGLEV